jgi:hypothetical protein
MKVKSTMNMGYKAQYLQNKGIIEKMFMQGHCKKYIFSFLKNKGKFGGSYSVFFYHFQLISLDNIINLCRENKAQKHETNIKFQEHSSFTPIKHNGVPKKEVSKINSNSHDPFEASRLKQKEIKNFLSKINKEQEDLFQKSNLNLDEAEYEKLKNELI